MMLLYRQAASLVVITTTSGVTPVDRVGVMKNFGFQKNDETTLIM